MKKFLIVIVPMLILLGACGDDVTTSQPQNTNKLHNENVNSYLVSADDIVYRCFDTGYKGGIWCTIKGRD